MRIALALSVSAFVSLSSLPALAQEPPSFTAGIGVASGSVFPDQAFTLSDGPVLEADAEACTGTGWCVSLFTVQSGEEGAYENDFVVSYAHEAGPLTLGYAAGYFQVAGEDILSATGSASVAVSDALSVTASYEAMTGGLETRVSKLSGTYERAVTDRWTVDLTLAVGHDTSIDAVVASMDAGVTYALTDTLGIRFFGTGYESSVGSDAVFGASFRVSW
ncbi:MAG: hypothetical protein V4644_00030 [Patescibacteria group bacterium]